MSHQSHSPAIFPDLNLDPAAENYAVFGNPVAHSKSPLIHRMFAQQTGQRLHYQAVQIPEGQFHAALDRFQSLGGKGLNITLPFKAVAWAAVTERSPRAQHCGSVNTIRFSDNDRRYGETTDGLGLLRDIARQEMQIQDRQVLILGAGGAVAGVLPDILAQAPARLVIANRTVARAEELLSKIDASHRVQASDYAALAGRKFDLIINGTSLSLQGSLPPLPDGIVAEGGGCYDMVYADNATPFCRWAQEQRAARISDGLGMLVEQAAESFLIWRGVRPDTIPVMERLRSPAGSV